MSVAVGAVSAQAAEPSLSLRYQPGMADFAGSHSQAVDDAARGEIEQAPKSFGEAESRHLYLVGGGGAQFDTTGNRVGQLGVGVSYFIVDDLSLDFEFNALYFDQSGGDAVGGNLNLLMRYHVINEGPWTVYVDGGAGVLGTTRSVPISGSQFNFTPQAGFGFTRALDGESRLMAGVRWHHVSNARTSRPNPGRDSFLLYGGVIVPF